MTLNVDHPNVAGLPPTLLPVSPPAPALVLLGRDQGGKPHASSFDPDDAPVAERAAALMGFRTFLFTNEHQTLVAGLTRGKIFSSGRAFVPFIKADIYSRLLEAADLPDTPSPPKVATKAAGNPPASKGGQGGGNTPGGAGGGYKRPTGLADVGVNSLVLATTGGPQEGWFEAVVMYTKADDHFELRWRDFPLDANFSRHRHQLALLHPGEAAEADPS